MISFIYNHFNNVSNFIVHACVYTMHERKEGSNTGSDENVGSGWERSLIIRFKIIIILVSFFTVIAAVNFYPDHYNSMYTFSDFTGSRIH